MPESNKQLIYGGRDFNLTHYEATRLLHTLESIGAEVQLFRFTPVGAPKELTITIGAGIPVVIESE